MGSYIVKIKPFIGYSSISVRAQHYLGNLYCLGNGVRDLESTEAEKTMAVENLTALILNH